MDIEKNTQAGVGSRTPSDLTWIDVEELSKFTTDSGKILSRKITGLSARHQRHITRMIKRARNMLLMK